MKLTIPFDQKISCSLDEAAAVTNISRTKLKELAAAGKLETAKVGRRRLVKIASLRALLEGERPVAA